MLRIKVVCNQRACIRARESNNNNKKKKKEREKTKRTGTTNPKTFEPFFDGCLVVASVLLEILQVHFGDLLLTAKTAHDVSVSVSSSFGSGRDVFLQSTRRITPFPVRLGHRQ